MHGEESTWHLVAQALVRPYPVTIPMMLLAAQVPVYLVLAERAREAVTHAPMVGLDRLIPLMPPWALVYGALYGWLILLPILVIPRSAAFYHLGLRP